MNRDRSARYHQLKRRASVLSVVWTALVLIFLVASGLHLRVRDLAGAWPRALQIALMLAAIGLLDQVAGLPLAFYNGYILEHRYELSTQRLSGWFVDHLKAAALGFVLSAAGLSVLYAVIANWPAAWWAIGAAGASIVMILLVNLGPILIMPLFFTVKPLGRDDLRDRLVALAERAGARVVGVFEWTLGDRTKKANAALTGVANTRRILLSDTLLSDYGDDEIEVVLAHELAHHVHHDMWKGIASETSVLFAGFFAADWMLRKGSALFGITGPADVAGLPVLLLAAAALSLLALPAVNAVSRANERAADRFAIELTRKPEAFVSAMRRLGQQNLAEDQPSRVVQWIFYSHPPVKERIASVLSPSPR